MELASTKGVGIEREEPAQISLEEEVLVLQEELRIARRRIVSLTAQAHAVQAPGTPVPKVVVCAPSTPGSGSPGYPAAPQSPRRYSLANAMGGVHACRASLESLRTLVLTEVLKITTAISTLSAPPTVHPKTKTQTLLHYTNWVDMTRENELLKLANRRQEDVVKQQQAEIERLKRVLDDCAGKHAVCEGRLTKARREGDTLRKEATELQDKVTKLEKFQAILRTVPPQHSSRQEVAAQRHSEKMRRQPSEKTSWIN